MGGRGVVLKKFLFGRRGAPSWWRNRGTRLLMRLVSVFCNRRLRRMRLWRLMTRKSSVPPLFLTVSSWPRPARKSSLALILPMRQMGRRLSRLRRSRRGKRLRARIRLLFLMNCVLPVISPKMRLPWAQLGLFRSVPRRRRLLVFRGRFPPLRRLL